MLGAVLARRPDLQASALAVVGSRAHGHADEGSDWDLVALTGDDPTEATIEPFPPGAGPRAGTLAAVREWRRSRPFGGLEIELLGPSARRRRERSNLAIWWFELSNARLLHAGWDGFDGYRDSLGARFAAERRQLAISQWARARLGRNEALSALGHDDPYAATLAGARAVGAAARAYLLWTGSPYPPDKWLLAVVGERGGDRLVQAARTVIDRSAPAEDRFTAVQQVMGELEQAMSESGADWDDLGDWWLRI